MAIDKIQVRQLHSVLMNVIFLFISISTVSGQSDEEQILNIRNNSNAALRAYNIELVLSFLTEEVLITTGNGTLLAGKEALRQYIMDAGESKMYWIRTPDEIVVNESKGLAWENGMWKGYDPDQGTSSIIGGKYSAMWTKETGKWLIKSQLFVTL